ncbi:sensor histidine kinase [Nannocystis pusilla]|uniref:sensor histidine kinase n=1 Tax=Nannocystis pusilla TaxID=889268 RepID=UPI003B7EDBE6
MAVARHLGVVDRRRPRHARSIPLHAGDRGPPDRVGARAAHVDGERVAVGPADSGDRGAHRAVPAGARATGEPADRAWGGRAVRRVRPRRRRLAPRSVDRVVRVAPAVPRGPAAEPPQQLHAVLDDRRGRARGLYARRERRRATEAAQLSAQLAEAQLAALKAQLHPHFLFNALGSISELVHLDPDGADRMLVKLSALLRRALDVASTQEVTLAEELSFLQPYLEIEQVRFADRLTVCWDIEPQARAALVPHLALQPLLENAIVHGIAPRAGGGTVGVAAWVVGERLVLAVRDDGVGSAGRVRAGVGVGLTNTRARLERLYGAAHRFTVSDVAGGGVEVMLELPLRRSAGGAQ